MGDFDELKKRIEVFLKDVKGFASEIPNTSTETEKHQGRFIELRTQEKAFTKEVNEFKPAKKIFFFDSKKSGLVKSLQEEITKASKMMEKHKIPVPEEVEEKLEAAAAAAPAEGEAGQVVKEDGESVAVAAPAAATVTADTAAPKAKPRQEVGASASVAAATATPAGQDGEDGDEDEEEDEFEEEEEEDEEEEEEEEKPPAEVKDKAAEEKATPATAVAERSATQPKPAPRHSAASTEAVAAAVAPKANGEGEGQVLEEEEEDEEEDGSEEEEEEDDMKSLGPDEPNLFEVQQAYTGQDADMLSIVKGEQLIVLRVGADGWWLARNSRGDEGLVPSTLLREVEESEEEDDEEEEGDGEESDDEAESLTMSTQPLGAGVAAAAGKSAAGQQQQETESWIADTDSSSQLTLSESEASTHQLSLTQEMLSPSQLSPGLPTGFRASTLAKWFYEGHNLTSQLAPKLTRSCLCYRDLQFDQPTQQLKPLPSRVDKLLLLQKCTFMPAELPVKVVDRLIRMCLFDGHGPVSNVHTVRAVTPAGGKDASRVWTFASRLVDSTAGLEFGETYLRYNYAPNHVQLLLEATLVCAEQSAGDSAEPDKLMELSIGHATVPLCDDNGGPVPARAFDLQLEGGTPFEHQLDVDPNLSKPGGQPTGLFKSATNRQPRIQLKFSQPSREVKDFMNTCPSTIIGSVAHLQLHSLYRHALGAELGEGSRLLERNAAPIYGPCLVQFPIMADQPDLMDLIRRRWNEFAKRDRAYRKPQVTEVMKQEFIRIVKSTYFLNQVKDFQPYVFGNKAQEQARANQIQDFQRRIATDQTGVSFSLCADFVLEPFSLQEVALPMLGPHSVPVIPVAVE